MKYFLPILLLVIIVFQTNSAFSACSLDPDWPEKPCLDTPPYTNDEQKTAWMPYYEHKGSQWMEMKKIEMEQSMYSGNLESWKRANSANYNVWYYNTLFGDISQKEIDLIKPHDPYADDESLRLASEKKFVSEESMGGGSGMGFFDASHFTQSTLVLAIIIGVGSGMGLTFYLRKRK